MERIQYKHPYLLHIGRYEQRSCQCVSFLAIFPLSRVHVQFFVSDFYFTFVMHSQFRQQPGRRRISGTVVANMVLYSGFIEFRKKQRALLHMRTLSP